MANEKRLIDANALKRHMVRAMEISGVRNITKEDFVYCIDNSDTVDAVEVVHGRWVQKEIRELLCSSIVPHCSVCNALKIQDKWNYCPNCGAKMDGDGNA